MSENLKEGDNIQVEGKAKILRTHRACNHLVVFMSKDEKTQQWDMRNPDGSKHVCDVKPARPFKKPSFWVGVSQEVSTSATKELKRTFTMSQEFVTGETKPEDAYTMVNLEIKKMISMFVKE